MATTTAARPPTGQRRDFKGMERLRLRAARMFEHGASQAEVAHRLDTSRQNAHRWYRKWQQGGRDALRAAGRAGCPGSSADVASGTGSCVGSRASKITPGHHLRLRA